MTQELESRVIDLEIQITHQANTIDDLSQMVSRQWDIIDRLTKQVKLLQDSLVELEENMVAPPGNEKPPHY
nr:SlyX family protein [uncultured Cohaesibacter sp.]